MSDADRKVKERTLELEVRHAEATGKTFRDAETANIRNLERLAARKRDTIVKPVTKPSKPAFREVTHEDLQNAGIRKRQAAVTQVTRHRCGAACGHCFDCRALARTVLVRQRLPNEPRLAPIANALAVMTIAIGMKRRFRDLGIEFPFDHPSELMRRRAYDGAVGQILDRTTPILGAWR